MNLKTYFSSPANFAVFITEDDKVMVWGEDYRGSLGLGGIGSLEIPHPLDLSSLLKNGEKLMEAACGAYHTVLLTTNNRIVVWGRNDAGQLGLGHRDDASVPVLLDLGFLPANEKIKKVRCGSFFSALITSNGDLWTFGDNTRGQVGRGVRPAGSTDSPGKVSLPSPVHELDSGRDHTLCLLQDGSFYGWGANDMGFLGLPGNHPRYDPVLLDLPEPVTDIGCGLYFSTAITISGSLYIWGSYSDELTTPLYDGLRFPKFCLGDCKKVICGGYQLFVVKKDDTIWWWSAESSDSSLPTGSRKPVTDPWWNLTNITFICACYRFSFVMDKEGNLYPFGDTTKSGMSYTPPVENRRQCLPSKFSLPCDNLVEQAWEMVKWIFLAKKSDVQSIFSQLPVEVMYNMVQRLTTY